MERRFRVAIVLAAFFSQTALAGFKKPLAPLIRHADVAPEDFIAYARAHGRETLAEFLLRARPATPVEAKLRPLVESAQAAWLSGEIATAQSVFKEIAALALEADWRESERRAIQYAHLRLAQSVPEEPERRSWLAKAIVAFPDLRPSADLYPPPLLAALEAERAEVTRDARAIALATRFPDARFVLVNGREWPVRSRSSLILPPGRFRVTVFSDRSLPLTQILTMAELAGSPQRSPPLATGSCATPDLSQDLKGFPSVSVLYGADCVREKDAGGWRPRELTLAELAPATPEPDFAGLQKQPSIPSPVSPAGPARSSKKAWILAAAGLAAAGLIYAAVRSQEPERRAPSQPQPVYQTEPVVRHGF